jgi:hypothetical protein
MRFQAKSDEELLNLLPEGEYDFFVKQAEDTVSKKGNEMIKLTLGILDSNNKEHMLFDYLLESLAFKVKHFAEAVGLEDKYNAGCYVAEDCRNKSGRCYITRQEAKDGFQAKNNVSDYIRASDVSPKQNEEKKFDDSLDIPF